MRLHALIYLALKKIIYIYILLAEYVFIAATIQCMFQYLFSACFSTSCKRLDSAQLESFSYWYYLLQTKDLTPHSGSANSLCCCNLLWFSFCMVVYNTPINISMNWSSTPEGETAKLCISFHASMGES